VVDNVEKIAKEKGISMAQLSLAWMLSKPFLTSPIVGTTAVHHVEEAVAALDIQLSEDEIKALEAPYVTHPVLGMM
jgi:aryl-alcohol dehydrogenase-like predicted oxidoreductase